MTFEHVLPVAASFPLPFRVLFLASFGLLCWATNLHTLHALGIDITAALDIGAHDARHASSNAAAPRISPGFKSFQDPSTLYKPIYKLFVLSFLWTLFGWLLYRHFLGADVGRVDMYKHIPGLFSLFIMAVLASPINHFEKRERDMFLVAVSRCIFPPKGQPIYFSDVVLADIFTSYAKVIGDVWLSIYMLLPWGTLLKLPSHDGWARWMVPVLMSVPYAIRLQQCCTEYMYFTNTSSRPLFNALKYASAFPVIFLSAAQGLLAAGVHKQGKHGETWHGEHQLFRLWILAGLINSLYSCWWDVTNDWGLELFSSSNKAKTSPPSIHRSSHSVSSLSSPSESSQDSNHSVHVRRISRSDLHPRKPSRPSTPHRNLRPFLLFPAQLYYLVVIINVFLRLTWSVKLLQTRTDGGVVIFWIEIAELLRRWMWVFFRVEWEIVKKADEYLRNVEEWEVGTMQAAHDRVHVQMREVDGEMLFDSEAPS